MKKSFSFPHQTLWNIPFYNGTIEQLLALIISQLQTENGLLTIATPNPEQIVLAETSEKFAKDLLSFNLFIPDGIGVIWASRWQQKHLLGRITGADLVVRVLKVAKQQRLKVVVVGGRNYQQISEKYGFTWLEGYENVHDPSSEQSEDVQLRSELQQLKPDIIFVALGAPFQEAWVARHHQFLKKINVKLVMVVGGSFDYLSGQVPRAPKLIRRLGFEWLYRLIKQPWRLRRQLKLLTFIRMSLTKD